VTDGFLIFMNKFILTICTLFLTQCAEPIQYTQQTKKVEPVLIYSGKSSFYADRFEGRKTANGEIFRQSLFTAAVPVKFSYMVGDTVTVCNLDTCITVRINDTGNLHGRQLDLSKSAFAVFCHLDSGLTRIHIYEYNSNIN